MTFVPDGHLAGAIAFTLVAYVTIRLCRGHPLQDIIKLRRQPNQQYTYVEEQAPPLIDALPQISESRRFSIRTWRTSGHFSILSQNSRRTTASPQARSSPDFLAPPDKQTVPCTQPRRPPPIRIVPSAAAPKIVGSFLVSPTSTLIGSSLISPPESHLPTRPSTVYTSKSGFSRLTPVDTDFSALPQMIKLQKPGMTKTINITARQEKELRTRKALSRSLRSMRWSGSTSDLPPTPHLALERSSSTDSRPSQLRVKGKCKDKMERGKSKRQT